MRRTMHSTPCKANINTGYSVSIRQSFRKSRREKWSTVEKVNYLKDTVLIPEES